MAISYRFPCKKVKMDHTVDFTAKLQMYEVINTNVAMEFYLLLLCRGQHYDAENPTSLLLFFLVHTAFHPLL